MLRFRVRGLSLIHGVLAASAWAGVTVATRALHAPLSASCRHAAPFLRTARVLLVVFGFAFGSLAFAQTASFSYAIAVLGGGFSKPYGVAVDGSGNVYVADFFNNAVKEMPAGCASSSCVTTLGSGFFTPAGVAVDRSGNVYVADWINGGAVKEMPTGCAS
jgi:DNA-binding beta-propeller fold protein YncE